MPDAGRWLGLSLLGMGLCLPVSVAGTNIALALATAALAFHRVQGGRWDWRRLWVPTTWCLCLYCAVAVLTSLTGVSPAVSLRNLPKDLHKLWVFLLLLLAFRTVLARRLPTALTLGFVFAAAAGIAQSLHDTYQSILTFHTGWAWTRARAFVHPVTFGELLALGLLGGLAFWGRGREGRAQRAQGVFFLCVVGSACILNQTRAAFLGLLLGFAVMCGADQRLRRWLKYGFWAAVLGAALLELLPTRRSLFAALGESGFDFSAVLAHSQFDRFKLWDVAWRMFLDHPWLGVGPANYETAFTQYFQGLIARQQVWSSAHNLILHQMAERGLVGLVALLALGWALFRRAWQRACRAPEPWNLWALGATAAFFFMNLFETAFQSELVTTLFLLIWTRAEAGCDD